MMTDPGQEREHHPRDPVRATDRPDHDERLDTHGGEKDHVEVASRGEPSSHSGSDNGQDEKEKRPGLEHTKSYATTASAVTRTNSQADEPTNKKPWYKNVNPLRWGKIPPVPETRQVSREYGAPFLSLVYFQWMAPIMSVSLPSPPCRTVF